MLTLTSFITAKKLSQELVMLNKISKARRWCLYYNDFQEVVHTCQNYMRKLKSDEHGCIFLLIARSIDFPSDIFYEENYKFTSDPPKTYYGYTLSDNQSRGLIQRLSKLKKKEDKRYFVQFDIIIYAYVSLIANLICITSVVS